MQLEVRIFILHLDEIVLNRLHTQVADWAPTSTFPFLQKMPSDYY